MIECRRCAQPLSADEELATPFCTLCEADIRSWEAANQEAHDLDTLDPLDVVPSSYGWAGKLTVTTVEGEIEHETGAGLSINQLTEMLFNLYDAGVEDTDPEFRNPALHEAVKITITITKEVF